MKSKTTWMQSLIKVVKGLYTFQFSRHFTSLCIILFERMYKSVAVYALISFSIFSFSTSTHAITITGTVNEFQYLANLRDGATVLENIVIESDEESFEGGVLTIVDANSNLLWSIKESRSAETKIEVNANTGDIFINSLFIATISSQLEHSIEFTFSANATEESVRLLLQNIVAKDSLKSITESIVSITFRTREGIVVTPSYVDGYGIVRFPNQGEYLFSENVGYKPRLFDYLFEIEPVEFEFVDLDGDGDLDSVVGLDNGRLKLFINQGSNENINFVLVEESDSPFTEIINSLMASSPISPEFIDIDSDGDFDLFIGVDAAIKFYENVGTIYKPDFEEGDFVNPLSELAFLLAADFNPEFVDLDNDGDQDLTVTATGCSYDLEYANYCIFYLRNDSTEDNISFTNLEAQQNPLDKIESRQRMSLSFFDYDNDNDFDIFIGSRNWNNGENDESTGFLFYENVGSTNSASYESTGYPRVDKTSYGSSEVFFQDVNQDSLLDGFRLAALMSSADRSIIGWTVYKLGKLSGYRISIVLDYDSDRDGIANQYDDFPNDPGEWKDSDGDSVGDNTDEDDDNDGILDSDDNLPYSESSRYLSVAAGHLLKVDSSGSFVPEWADSWSCVIDLNSGFIWEVKTPSGIPDSMTESDFNQCNSSSLSCSIPTYKEIIKEHHLCGNYEWEIPSAIDYWLLSSEYSSLFDVRFSEYLNIEYFPNLKVNDDGKIALNVLFEGSFAPFVFKRWNFIDSTSAIRGGGPPSVMLVSETNNDDIEIIVNDWLATHPLADTDHDGIRDVEEIELRSDPLDPRSPFENGQKDTDADGIINLLDLDDDNDGVIDTEDDYPLEPTLQRDADYDGVPDDEDALPNNPDEYLDNDLDGIGDNADTDDDNDGLDDETEIARGLDPYTSNIGSDADSDGYSDIYDEFPFESTEYIDSDHDGVGNNADTDDDNDGVLDSNDALPFMAGYYKVTSQGQIVTESDTWSCVLDATNNLLWEVKTSDGLHNKDTSYGWYQEQEVINNGYPGAAYSVDDCDGYQADNPDKQCNTQAYAQRVNTRKLCNINTWALPSKTQLETLVNKAYSPVINSDYFVDDINTANTNYWTSTTDPDDALNAYAVNFTNGFSSFSYDKLNNYSVRLVVTDITQFGHWDSDGDGYTDSQEIIDRTDPYNPNSPEIFELADFDGDGINNLNDTDDDNDGVPDSEDALPLNAAETLDFDGDGLGDIEDTDDDFDGFSDEDELDNGTDPNDSNSYPDDTDSDYVSDINDIDDDNDGIPDNSDDFPNNRFEWKDTDGDGVGDNADTDDDNDGISDSDDQIPFTDDQTYVTGNVKEFTKLSASGNMLVDDAEEWACVLDKEQMLIWEVKRSDGSIQDIANRVIFSQSLTNDAECNEDETCDFTEYENSINAMGLCGSSNWEVPLVSELRSLYRENDSDYIDSKYFPNNTTNENNYFWVFDPDHYSYPTYRGYSFLLNGLARRLLRYHENGDFLSSNSYTSGVSDSWENERVRLNAGLEGDQLQVLLSDIIAKQAQYIKDSDYDGIPDAEEIANRSDPYDPRSPYHNTQADNDGDGIINILDEDDDNDGVIDIEDNYPFNANQQRDADYDGVPDEQDAMPFDPEETEDTDLDGIGNNADEDDDNDGVADNDDDDPLVFSLSGNKQWQFDGRFPNNIGLWAFNDVTNAAYDDNKLVYLLKEQGELKSITVFNEAGNFIRQVNLSAQLELANIDFIDIQTVDEQLWVYTLDNSGVWTAITYDEYYPDGKVQWQAQDIALANGEVVLSAQQSSQHFYITAAISSGNEITGASVHQLKVQQDGLEHVTSLDLSSFGNASGTLQAPAFATDIHYLSERLVVSSINSNDSDCVTVALFNESLQLINSITQTTEYCGTTVETHFARVNQYDVVWVSTAGIHHQFAVVDDELLYTNSLGISPYGTNNQGWSNIDLDERVVMTSGANRTLVIGQGFLDLIENTKLVSYLSSRVLGQGIRTDNSMLLEGGNNLHVVDATGQQSLLFNTNLNQLESSALPSGIGEWNASTSRATLYDSVLGFLSVESSGGTMNLHQWGIGDAAHFDLDLTGLPLALHSVGEEFLLVWQDNDNRLVLSRYSREFSLIKSSELDDGQDYITSTLTADSLLLVITGDGDNITQWLWREGYTVPVKQTRTADQSIFTAIDKEEISDVAVIDSFLLVATNTDGIWQTDLYGNKLSKLNLRSYGAGSGNNVDLRVIGNQLFILDRNEYRLYKLKRVSQLTNAKAIIVAGGGPYPGNVLWTATLMNANFAYQALTGQGYSKENIRYFAEETFDLDGNGELDDFVTDFSKAGLQDAITNWASDADSLVIYFVDHGGVDKFRMGSDTIVESSEVASWLDSWQADNSNELILIYDACKSGSFMDELSAEGRIIVASTSADEDAYFLSNGAVSFSAYFWQGVWNGQSLGDTYSYTQSVITGNLELSQTPQLSVDGEYNNSALIAETYIGSAKEYINSLPQIGSVNESVAIQGSSLNIIANDVTDADGIARVWAVIWPPLYGSSEAVAPVIDLPQVDLQLIGNNNYQYSYRDFKEEGTYRVAIYATDSLGNTSESVTFDVTVEGGVTRRAIIIEGGVTGSESADRVASLGSAAYNALIKQGFDPSSIYYLAPQLNANYQNYYLSSEGNIEFALTEWAENSLDVAIYLVGDANLKGELILADGNALNHETLKNLTTQLQSNISGTLTLVADIPYAGNIINELQTDNAENHKRIILTGGSSDEPAYWLGNRMPAFSNYFWRQVSSGANLRTAFRYAVKALKFPRLRLSPQLNDDGSDTGNEKSDGYLARDYILGGGLLTAGDEPLIGDYEEGDEITLEPAQGLKALRLTKITSTSDLTDVVAHVVFPPDSQGLVKIETVALSLLANGDYQAWFIFEQQGEYQVTFEATNVDGYVSLPMSIVVVQPSQADNIAIDITPPMLDVPNDLILPVYEDNQTYVAEHILIQQFLLSASAFDEHDGHVDVTFEAPNIFEPGITVVTFFASDSAGNTSIKTASIIIDGDMDGDGYLNWEDAFPTNGAIAVDSDGDGLADEYVANCDSACQSKAVIDEDDDNDGIPDAEDAEPTNPRNAIARPSEAGDLIVPLGNDNAIPVRFAYEASSNTYSVTPVTTGNTVTFTGEYRKVWLYELPDMDGSGAYEYGLFGIRSDEGNEERLQLFIRDSETGAKVSILNWVDNWSQVSIVVLNDITGDGVTDFGLQGYLKAGYRPQLSLKNGLTNKGLGNVGFPNLWNSPTYMGFSDMTGDGVDEIALFGFIKRNDKPQVKVVDGSKPNRKLKAYTFPSKWEEVSWHNVGDYNGDGEDDWGLLGHAKSDGRWQLIVKDGTQPRGALAIYAWPNMSDTTLMQLADATGDGVKEIALGGLNTKGRWQLQIKDGQDRNNTVKNMTWANNRSQSSLHVIGDVDGDGKDELAQLGMDGEGSFALIIKTSVDDYSSELTMPLGNDWLTMPVISQYDTNGDGQVEWVAWGQSLSGATKVQLLIL